MNSKLVVLSLGEGDLSEGFAGVTASLWATNNSRPMKFIGSLPPAPEILEIYRQWRLLYEALSQRLRKRAVIHEEEGIEIQDGGFMNVSEVDLQELSDRFRKIINAWLNDSPFHNIERQLRTELSRSDRIRVIIETDDELLRRIPWHLWNFFDDYPLAEVALSTREWRVNPPRRKPIATHVKILAILGNSDGINTQSDRELLQNLPGASISFLPEPKRREINDYLWERGWDILFFAGHSQSNGETGKIYINQNDSLTIEQLKFALKKAIDKGLQLAIFNSCDGLGLARALADLNIPQIIVMREPVPDKVAQEFLKYFLEEYAGGESLYLAVRRARERLQGLEDEYRCASWLPVICQNPAEVPLTWEQLRRGNQHYPNLPQQKPLPPYLRFLLQPALITSIAIALLVLGIRNVGLLQTSELQLYDVLMRSRPDEGADPRLLIVAVTEEDLQYQRQKGIEGQGSLSDVALAQLLKKLQPLQPRTIGLLIYRDFPVKREKAELTTLLKNPNFFAMCKASDPTLNHPGVSPPPEVAQERLGFADVVTDDDGILRRHLWHGNFNNDSPCTTQKSFSLQLALHYLQAENIQPKVIQEDNLQLGKAVLTSLNLRTGAGGYQSLDDKGYQMLLNYRSRRIAQQVTLRQILENKFNPAWVKDTIVIIGTTAPSYQDDRYTPYSINQQPDRSMRGVEVQAQMVSQIISAAIDNRPLLRVWDWWGDALWIGVWSLTGGVLVWCIRGKIYLGLAVAVAGATLYGACLMLLIGGTWVPLVPSALALIGTAGSVIYLKGRFFTVFDSETRFLGEAGFLELDAQVKSD